MKLLTIDNAREILEKGETYRIGTNALNVLEFLYEHKGFKTKNPNFKMDPPFWKGGKVLFLNGLIFKTNTTSTRTTFPFCKIIEYLMKFKKLLLN